MTNYDYSPEEILADSKAPMIHKLYAQINIGVRDRREHWEKCMECGDPFQVTEEWSSTYFCCLRHEQAYEQGFL